MSLPVRRVDGGVFTMPWVVILEIGKNVFELRIKFLMIRVNDVKLITDVADVIL
jgi:hypothetical protein